MTIVRISTLHILLASVFCFLSFSTLEADAAVPAGIQVQLVLEEEDLETKSNQVLPLPTPRSDHVTIYRATNLRSISPDYQRRELSIWSSFMNFVHCPIHHDKNPNCHHHHSGGGGGSHSGGSGSGGSGGSGSGGSGGSGSGGSGGGGGGSSPDTNNGGNNNNNNGGNTGGDTNNGGTVTCNSDGCKDQNGDSVVTCTNNGCVDTDNNYVGDNCNANGCCDNNGICYDVFPNNRSPTQSPSPLDSVSNDDPEWANLSSEMIYGAIGLSGIAVVAGLLVRKRRQNVNLNDHLLNGAVNKRKRTFARLFRKKADMDPETPGATHYVKA